MVTYDGTHVLSVEVASSATRSLEPAGLPPPTAPRKVSSRAYNPQGGAGFMVLLGAFFLFLGAVFLIASLATFFTSEELEPAPLVIALVFGLVFGTVGATVLTSSYRTRSMRKRLYANGMAATATVNRSAPNRMFHVNGRSPTASIGRSSSTTSSITGSAHPLAKRLSRSRKVTPSGCSTTQRIPKGRSNGPRCSEPRISSQLPRT